MEPQMTKIRVPVEDHTIPNKTILLVEDNPQDEELTIRALRKSNIMNSVVVKRDGQEALDYFFGHRGHESRNPASLPLWYCLI